MYLISSCLVGVNCRYDGNNNLDEALLNLINSGKAIALCPEVLGNLPTPRECCEITCRINEAQKVTAQNGEDRTAAFLEGAQKTLAVCKILGISKAILKSKSPSCGSEMIYDGSFQGKLISGKGLTAQLLEENGIQVFDEQNWMKHL